MKIVIVDYGMGNIKSIISTLKYLNVEDIELSSEFDVMKKADKIILPGVGSFGKAIKHIKNRQIDKYLQELVVKEKKPILGICLGMQLMGNSSNEDGENEGLKLVDTVVRKFEAKNIKIPHVGFNQVRICNNSILYSGIKKDPDFYFTHSYRMLGNSDINQSYSDYGGQFIASFEIANLAGVQFHPELSQTNGLQLLRNFIDKF